MLARMRDMRQKQIESGLTPEAFAQEMRDRADAAQDRVDELKQGWLLPVLTGVVCAMTLGSIWTVARGDGGSWSALVTTLSTTIGIVYQFDADCMPPRRRLVGGILIGLAIAALSTAAFLVIEQRLTP